MAFGSFFASPTKPHAVPAPIELLSAARAKLDVPITAIGGITARNGAMLIEAGASFLAAFDGVFGSDDVEHAARGYAALFSWSVRGGRLRRRRCRAHGYAALFS